MGVGGVGGGGRRGGVGKGSAGGAKGAGGAGKAGKSTFGGKLERTEKLVGTGGATVAGGTAGVAAADPITATAMEIIAQLKSGQIKSKAEATKKLVAEVLQKKVRMKSQALTDKISETIQDDPRLQQALERLWQRAE